MVHELRRTFDQTGINTLISFEATFVGPLNGKILSNIQIKDNHSIGENKFSADWLSAQLMNSTNYWQRPHSRWQAIFDIKSHGKPAITAKNGSWTSKTRLASISSKVVAKRNVIFLVIVLLIDISRFFWVVSVFIERMNFIRSVLATSSEAEQSFSALRT